MSLIIPPGFVQLVHRFRIATDPEEMVFTMGAELGTETDPDTVAGLAAGALLEAFGTGYWSNESVFVGVTAYLGNDGPTIVGEYIVDEVGTDSRATLPSNCAFLIKKRTGLAGRRGRGRCYLPSCFLPESLVDSMGNISEVRHDADEVAVADWYDALCVSTPIRFADLVVFHDSEGSGPEPAPTVVTALQADQRIATRRTRMRP